MIGDRESGFHTNRLGRTRGSGSSSPNASVVRWIRSSSGMDPADTSLSERKSCSSLALSVSERSCMARRANPDKRDPGCVLPQLLRRTGSCKTRRFTFPPKQALLEMAAGFDRRRRGCSPRTNAVGRARPAAGVWDVTASFFDALDVFVRRGSVDKVQRPLIADVWKSVVAILTCAVPDVCTTPRDAMQDRIATVLRLQRQHISVFSRILDRDNTPKPRTNFVLARRLLELTNNSL